MHKNLLLILQNSIVTTYDLPKTIVEKNSGTSYLIDFNRRGPYYLHGSYSDHFLYLHFLDPINFYAIYDIQFTMFSSGILAQFARLNLPIHFDETLHTS